MGRSNLALVTGTFAFAASVAATTSICAAQITWSAPVNITGDSDVITTGTLITARNLSQTQVSPTVNGVFFDIFPIPNGGTGAAGINNVAALSYVNADSSDIAYGATVGPFTSLSASYRSLLSSGAGSSTGSPLTLTLLGLTNGSSYLFQWWSNDAGLAFGGVNSTTGSAGNAVTLDENTTDTAGGMGQWVSGTFTATGTFQAITFSGPRPVINAFQVREIPAPGAAAILALAGLVTARRRRA